ncbi:MAG: dipeptidase [Croceibacterium sp.]
MRRFALGLACLVGATSGSAQTPEETAQAALTAAPVWDGHNDVPEQLRGRYHDLIADFDFADTRGTKDASHPAMQTDLARLHQGRVGAQFWSVFVDATQPEPQAVMQTVEQIDVLKRLVARYPRDLELALTADDVARAMKGGRIASLIGMEGGQSIGSSLAVLRQMYALGARYLTLTHYKALAWADSADDIPSHHGLTPFGEKVVREMNRLGMIVDLSHVSTETMRDALAVARAPVIFSHSNARAVVEESRNVPDDVLRLLPANGGIVMVTGVADFVSAERRLWLAERAAETARQQWLWQGDPDKVGTQMAEWLAAHPEPHTTVAQLADHVDHIRQVAGIDHLGIGGDFDGWMAFPQGMTDVSGYPALFAELARRGYPQGDLEKISSRNMLRVMRSVEAYAGSHRTDAPIETPTS